MLKSQFKYCHVNLRSKYWLVFVSLCTWAEATCLIITKQCYLLLYTDLSCNGTVFPQRRICGIAQIFKTTFGHCQHRLRLTNSKTASFFHFTFELLCKYSKIKVFLHAWMFTTHIYYNFLPITFKFASDLSTTIRTTSFKECIFGELKTLPNDNNTFMTVSTVARDAMADSMFIHSTLCDV